jgi:hypothetical protein
MTPPQSPCPKQIRDEGRETFAEYEQRMHEYLRSRGVPELVIQRNVEIAREAASIRDSES